MTNLPDKPDRQGMPPRESLEGHYASERLRSSSAADPADKLQDFQPPLSPRAAPRPRLTTYCNTEVVERRPRPAWAVCWTLLTVLIGVVGLISGDHGWLLAASFPGCVAALLWWRWPKPARFRFTEQGIEADRPAAGVAYEEVASVFAPDRREGNAHFTIYLLHDLSYLTIPAQMQEASEDLYQFLRSQPRGQRRMPTVNPLLGDFLRQQLLLHDENDVHIYRAESSKRRPPLLRFWTGFFLVVTLTGITWGMLAPSLFDRRAADEWITLGVVFTFVGGLFFCIFGYFYLWPPRRVRNWQESGLVISPSGLGLVQGDLKGELRWREVLDVRFTQGMLLLKVEGAQIQIADLYHWPLAHAWRQIQRYWPGRER